MANVRISQLPVAPEPISGSELVPVVQNGQTVQTTVADLVSAPTQTQTFITVNQEPTLPNSRYLANGTGIGRVDGGAQGSLQLYLNGTSGSLEVVGTGIIAKTAANTVAARSIAVGSGLSIANADGVAGNPNITVTGLLAQLVATSGTGLLGVVGGTLITNNTVTGVADEISVANGNTAPIIGLADNPIVPLYGGLTLPLGSTAQRVDRLGTIRYNTDLSTFEGRTPTGWNQFSLTGGVTSFSAGSTGFTPSTAATGAVVLAGTLVTSNGGTGAAGTLNGYVYGNGTSAMTASATIPTTDLSGVITNAQLQNSSVTYNGVTVALGGAGTITSATTSTLTIGTGLSGGSFDGSAPVTIAIDSTVATLTGSQTLTNKTISGSSNTLTNIGNSSLVNNSVTYNGITVALGASGTITAINPYSLTVGTGLQLNSGTTYDGSAARTISIANTGVAAATYGASNSVPVFAVNAQGQVTSVTNTNIDAISLTTGSISTAPSGANDIANKAYVDSVAQGLDAKGSCLYGTTGDITLSGLGTQAGGDWAVSLTAGDRILVKNQASAANNGIYVASSTGWSRSADMDVWSEVPNAFVFVEDGTTLADTGWVCTSPAGGTINVSPINWTQFSGAGTYTAGTGLTLTGTQFSITNTGVTANTYGSASQSLTLTVNAQGQITSASAQSIAIAASQVTSGTFASSLLSGSYTGITGVGTLTAGTWNATTIGVGYGGTGLASYTTGDLLYASGTTTLSKLAIGATDYVLTSSGTAPQYVAQSTLSVGSATNASNVAVTTGAATTNYLAFVTATTGNLPVLTNTGLTYNSSTNKITGGIGGGTF